MSSGGISPRTVRIGGIAWVVGPLQFLVLTTLEALLLLSQGYSYSFLTNTISNLGDPSLFPFPYYWMLNASAIALGALVLVGLPAFRAYRPSGAAGTVASVLLLLTAIGAIGVGVFNEHLDYSIHISMATLAFVSEGLVLLVVGIAAFWDPGWKGWAIPSLVGAGVTAVALVFFAMNTQWLLGHGGWERLVVLPSVIWVILVGVKLLRTRPSSIPAARPG